MTTLPGKVSNEPSVGTPQQAAAPSGGPPRTDVAVPSILPDQQPALVTETPTPAWIPRNPYKRIIHKKANMEKPRISKIEEFITLVSTYIDVVVRNDTSLTNTPWYFLWTTYVQNGILSTMQISTVTRIIGYPTEAPLPSRMYQCSSSKGSLF